MHPVIHAVMAYYNYLVIINLWKDVLAVLVAGIIAWIIGIRKRLIKIEQHLDTSTPGGLTDVITAINRNTDKEVD